jgi:hypothetical protein
MTGFVLADLAPAALDHLSRRLEFGDGVLPA